MDDPYFITEPKYFIPNEIMQYLSKLTPFVEALFINYVISYFAGEQNQEQIVMETTEVESES